MSIPHPLLTQPPRGVHIDGQLLVKGKPISVPYASLSNRLKGLEKAGEIRIVKKGNQAVLIKL